MPLKKRGIQYIKGSGNHAETECQYSFPYIVCQKSHVFDFFCINILRLTFLERWISFMKKVSAKIHCVLSYYVCNNFKDDGR